MFDYQRLIKKLGEFNKLSKGKQRDLVDGILSDKDFAEFLFKPKGVPNLTEVVEQLYAGLSKPQVVKTIVKYVQEEGYEEFNRTHATFFYSLASLALETNNERAKENAEKKKSGQISNKEFNETRDKIDEYSKYIDRLLKITKKIVKKEAEDISDETAVPYKICRKACSLVPEANMIDRYKIGRYLDSLLNEVYDTIHQNEISIPNGVNWKGFFKKLFGKDNLAEVATFLLLEGHNRRDAYERDSNVIRCWDSLTEFALTQMNSAPEQIRDQMLELYLKRISRMFTNGTYELRVDLLSIPQLNGKQFPALSATIQKYAERLENIIKK